eukprot:SAG11_NODE_1102_length_5866_cov_2.173574_9_plen_281_part_00
MAEAPFELEESNDVKLEAEALDRQQSSNLPGTLTLPAGDEISPSEKRRPARVGLAVEAFSRKLIVVGRNGSPSSPSSGASQCEWPSHQNLEAAQAAGVPLWMTIENDTAWEWFKELDTDQSGVLDMQEAKQLCSKLNLKVRDFKNVFRELDVGGDGTVSFSEFVHWYNERKAEERRGTRLLIRDIFDKLDKDNSGSLSKDEIVALVKKAKDRLKLVDPPFDVEKDWAIMKKTRDEVTFVDFEGWWKERSGIVEPDIPVLPEVRHTSKPSRVSEVAHHSSY